MRRGFEGEFMAVFFGNCLKDGDGAVRDLGADAVAREHCNVFFHVNFLRIKRWCFC